MQSQPKSSESDRKASVKHSLADQTNLKGVPDIYDARRQAIYYLYTIFGSPEPDDWDETLNEIMRRLSIPKCSKMAVRKVLENIYEPAQANEHFNSKATLSLRGRDGPQCTVIVSWHHP